MRPLPPGPLPPAATRYVNADGDVIRFMDFEPGSAKPRKEHIDFIRVFYVNDLIDQIERAGFADRTMTVHLFGYASATGSKTRNDNLSTARARAIGEAVKLYFDQQKGTGRLSKDVQVVIDAQGKGDEKARAVLREGGHTNLPEYLVEKGSGAARSVWVSRKARHRVVDEDKIIRCRLMLSIKVQVAQTGLEGWIAQVEKTHPFLGAVLKEELKNLISELKALLKKGVDSALEELGAGAPVALIFAKGIEYMIPSDVAERYQFQDARGLIANYDFIGVKHRVELSILDIFLQLLGLVRWCSRLPKELQDLDDSLAKSGEGRLNLNQEQVDRIKKFITDAKKAVKTAEYVWAIATAKGGPLRKLLGDGVVDGAIRAVNTAKGAVFSVEDDSTEWSTVTMAGSGLYDIHSFGGTARVSGLELPGRDMTIHLEFAAPHGISELEFRGDAYLRRKWRLSTVLFAGQNSTGTLKLTT